MKKLLSIILSLVMFSTYCCADALIPEFLTAPVTNYTADYTLSFAFKNSEDVANLPICRNHFSPIY